MSAGKATKKEPMTFSKSFRGRWTNKNIPVIPKKMSKKRSYLMHRRRTSLQFSDQYLEQFRAFAMKEGAQVIFYVTDNKDGTFTSGFKMGKLSQKCVFKLDGKPVNMTGNTDGKEMTSTNTFKKGVWKSKITRTGCPDVIRTETGRG